MTPINTPYGYEPNLIEKIKIGIAKNYQFYLGRFLQFIMYNLWKTIGFIAQMFRDAVGK